MTLFEDDRYAWRETYYVYFISSHRPKGESVRCALHTSVPLFQILEIRCEFNGDLASMIVASYENHSALEILYQSGRDTAVESEHLFRSLKSGASSEELDLLKKIVSYKSRLVVHHFEQTAGTGIFNIAKLPELNFSRQTTFPDDQGNMFLKAFGLQEVDQEKFGKKALFFDAENYALCRGITEEDNIEITDNDAMDSGEYERINPEMLVSVLEILCRLTKGIVLDPASGIVWENNVESG